MPDDDTVPMSIVISDGSAVGLASPVEMSGVGLSLESRFQRTYVRRRRRRGSLNVGDLNQDSVRL